MDSGGGGQPFQMGMKSGGGNSDFWPGQAPVQQQKMMYSYSLSPLSSPQQPQSHMLPYQQQPVMSAPQSSQQQRFNMYMPAAPAPSIYYQGSGGNIPFGGAGQQEADKDSKRYNPSPYLQSTEQPTTSGYSIVPPLDNAGHFGGEDLEEMTPAPMVVSSVPNSDHESHSRPPEGATSHFLSCLI